MDWQPIINQTVSILAPIAGTLIVTLAGIGIKRFNAWIRTRDLGDRLKTALVQISEATVSTVADLEATVRPYMSDGKLSKEEAAEIKAAALNRINTLVPQSVQVLAEAGMQDLDTYIGGKIEQEVAKLPESTKPEVSSKGEPT